MPYQPGLIVGLKFVASGSCAMVDRNEGLTCLNVTRTGENNKRRVIGGYMRLPGSTVVPVPQKRHPDSCACLQAK